MSVIFGLIVLSVDAYHYPIFRHWTHSDTAQEGTEYLEIDYNSATERRDRGLIGDLKGMNMDKIRQGDIILCSYMVALKKLDDFVLPKDAWVSMSGMLRHIQ